MATKQGKRQKVKFKQYKSGDLLIVHWRDITSHDGWMDEEQAANMSLLDIMSVGWLINQDDELIRITNTFQLETSVKNCVSIPEAVIEKVMKIKI